ncbi:hypothetical protein CDL15_Pgr007411 [Punica granatum]|uniref:Cellulose synthase-like protein E1 n=1 Tax=Punica granatum TaxID=22663 RepID=A0A218X8W2_PUNGR|nr:hypothetical protein CDL15_Pgr007411 [Punica granatum]
MGSDREEQLPPLFVTSRGKGTFLYRAFAGSVFLGISLIWVYRLAYLPDDDDDGSSRWRRWAWVGMLGAELWFGFYWILTQASRWNLVYRQTFKDRLALRYEHELPGVDIFVCTADPAIEPPAMVVSTVLSVMAYDYPTEKLGVYLSDDAGSELTYYALLEASRFAKHWLPFCKKFKVEPTSPAAFFNNKSSPESIGTHANEEFRAIKKLYEEMENRIDTTCKLNRVPDQVRSDHEEFSQWDSYSSKRDHDAIIEMLIDRTDPASIDNEGNVLPTLVYMAREKRPDYFHNFKAGAMNSLIRVSSVITGGEIILNVDCDMYSNNSKSIRDALCFFMDEEKGHEIAFVQFPQNFVNVTKNELYGSSLQVINNIEFHGMDGYGGVLYIGSGCFHRRDILCGMKYSKEVKRTTLISRRSGGEDQPIGRIHDPQKLRVLASCTYEKNTKWGNEVGLKYGCPVEDIITGLAIKCRGWKAVYHNPEQMAFLGLAPTTLLQTLVQHKRWSEGDFQIALSKYGPARYGPGRISPGLILCYLTYCLWVPNCIPTLYYSMVPSVYLLRGTSLFPEISSPWVVPFVYVIFAKYAYSLVEFLQSGGTVLGWWNEQRIWLYKRTSSYLFALIDTIVKLLGFSKTTFVITAKVADEDVLRRYEAEVMELGATSPMFTLISTLALLNLTCLLGFGIRLVMMSTDSVVNYSGSMFLQGVLCGVLVLINFPLYQGMFIRKDAGKMPIPTTVTSVVLAVSVCTCFAFLY